MRHGDISKENIFSYIFGITSSVSFQRSVGGVCVGDLMAQSPTDGTYLDSRQRRSKKFNFLMMPQRRLQTFFNSDSDFLCYFQIYFILFLTDGFAAKKLSVVQLGESAGFKTVLLPETGAKSVKTNGIHSQINELKEALGQIPPRTILLHHCLAISK